MPLSSVAFDVQVDQGGEEKLLNVFAFSLETSAVLYTEDEVDPRLCHSSLTFPVEDVS